jgi:hypothetical protein
MHTYSWHGSTPCAYLNTLLPSLHLSLSFSLSLWGLCLCCENMSGQRAMQRPRKLSRGQTTSKVSFCQSASFISETDLASGSTAELLVKVYSTSSTRRVDLVDDSDNFQTVPRKRCGGFVSYDTAFSRHQFLSCVPSALLRCRAEKPYTCTHIPLTDYTSANPTL